MSSNIPQTQKFNGKTYQKDIGYWSKEAAQKRVFYLHNRSVLARIITFENVYTRTKRFVVYKRDEF